jgi:hypothetical protein
MNRLLMPLVWLTLVATTLSYAKRMAPAPVPPVVQDGVKYVAPNDDGRRAYVQAWSTDGKQLLWEVTVFRNANDPALEEDVQWVFIKQLRLDNGKLLVVSERDQVYSVDLKTRAVKAVKSPHPAVRNPAR